MSGSLLFGTLMAFTTPPLRGPDETAHFLRAYGIAQGDFVPSIRDDRGRKGIFLPPRLYQGFDYFESVRVKAKEPGFGYGPVLREYFSGRAAAKPVSAPVFVPYGGSEGYSPVAYLPQSAAALVARILDLEFLTTLYLMRLASLVAFSGIIALAIMLLPHMAWAVVVIAMLPAALYGRSVVSADGGALAAAVMVTALWLRRMFIPLLRGVRQQSFWMAMGALTKPPNVTLALLELIAPPDPSVRRWRVLAVVTLPAVAVALLWSLLSGGDTASWRMVEITGREPAAFDPIGKIVHLLSSPWDFPLAVGRALIEQGLVEPWRQVIGVLGLFDTVLHDWVYLALTALLLVSFVAQIPATPAMRTRIAVAAAVTALCYWLLIYFICYLVFTPLDAGTVWGVQGRYFVPILPLIAIVVAALVNRVPAGWLSAATAVTAVTLAGVSSVAAILAADWNWN